MSHSHTLRLIDMQKLWSRGSLISLYWRNDWPFPVTPCVNANNNKAAAWQEKRLGGSAAHHHSGNTDGEGMWQRSSEPIRSHSCQEYQKRWSKKVVLKSAESSPRCLEWANNLKQRNASAPERCSRGKTVAGWILGITSAMIVEGWKQSHPYQ